MANKSELRVGVRDKNNDRSSWPIEPCKIEIEESGGKEGKVTKLWIEDTKACSDLEVAYKQAISLGYPVFLFLLDRTKGGNWLKVNNEFTTSHEIELQDETAKLIFVE